METLSIYQELGKFIVLFQTMYSALNDIIYQIAEQKLYVAEAFIAKAEFTPKVEISDVIFRTM